MLGSKLEKTFGKDRIQNEDDLCMARALVVAKAETDADGTFFMNPTRRDSCATLFPVPVSLASIC